jgi:VanZ family protein
MLLSIASASIIRSRLASLAQLNPWTWVAVINVVQTVGALIAIRSFGLKFSDVALPIIFLFLGAAAGIVFRSQDRWKSPGTWKWWTPAITYGFFIFFLSSRSYPDALPSFDTKWLHPIEYLTLALFLSLAWHPFRRSKGTFVFILCVLISGILFAVSDEFHQSFIPGRTAALSDVLIDSVGLAFGCGLFLFAGFVRERYAKTKR